LLESVIVAKPLTDQLRQAIEDSGLTRYEIAKRTGIAESTLSRFVTGRRAGLSMQALDALGECLGLTIVSRRKPSKGKGG
jgi:transcriptional regulator with XRE-family HTH domain